MNHHPAIKSVTSTDHKTTRILSQDAEDFIDAMETLNPTIGTYVRQCMERDDSKEGIRTMAAAFETVAKASRGWFIGRFGANR